MKNEFENIYHTKMEALNFLLVDISYRKPHLHTDIELAYVLSGSGIIKTQEKEWLISKGYGMVFNTCQVHEFIANQPIKLLIMQFNSETFETAFPHLDQIYFESCPFAISHESLLLQHMLAAASNYFKQDTYFSLQVHAHASLCLYELLQVCPHNMLSKAEQNKIFDLQERIQRITTYISKNYVNKITLDDLAIQEDFSRTYFSHFFKNNFKITFKEYLDNIRCEKALTLLSDSHDNLLTIAYSCGFSDIRTLNKAFQKHFGISPKSYRKNKTLEIQRGKNRFHDQSNLIDKQVIFDNIQSLNYLTKYADNGAF